MNELKLPDAPTADLPAIAKEAEEAWTKIEQSSLGDRMKSALRRIACGESIRGSAEAEGYSSHGDVYRYAKRYGIVDVRTRRLIDTHRRVARLSGEELEQRLATKPEEISTHDPAGKCPHSHRDRHQRNRCGYPSGLRVRSAKHRINPKAVSVW